MNGAIALPWARTSRVPTTRMTKTIGIIHQSFRCQKKVRTSPATSNRSPARLSACIAVRLLWALDSGFADDPVVEDEEVHARARERAQRVGRAGHDGLALEVEGRVQHDGRARLLAERLDEPVVAGIELTIDGLQPGAAVDVGDGGQLVAGAILDRRDVKHEARRVVTLGIRQ